MVQSSDKTPQDGPDSIFAGYISEPEYARQRGVTIRTCQRDRALRQAPPHVVLGKKVFYRVEAVRTWLEANERLQEKYLNAPKARTLKPPRRSTG